jgi:hypothetical protein
MSNSDSHLARLRVFIEATHWVPFTDVGRFISVLLFCICLSARAERQSDRDAMLLELRELRARIEALESRLEASGPVVASPTVSNVMDPIRSGPEVRLGTADSSHQKLSEDPESVASLPGGSEVLKQSSDDDVHRVPVLTLDSIARTLEDQEQRLKDQESRWMELRDRTDGTSPELIHKALKDKWYERISLRGYTQVRFTQPWSHGGVPLHVPADRSVNEDESFTIRRGRMILSGDVTSRVFTYGQMDFAASPFDGDWTLQMRDLYADISLDTEKTHRVRIGQSKVPFGWVNLQSSQNRAPLERPEGFNLAVEGERDLGAYYIWAPQVARQRFRELIRRGLKGSGDYGVVSVGGYSGQGLNRSDKNGEPHAIVHLTYPFQFENGRFLETSLHAYHGRFVVGTGELKSAGGTYVPLADGDGIRDQRVGWSAVLYPQPFGLEVAWNVGRGPRLDEELQGVRSDFLHGGYIQAMYRATDQRGDWFPFVRWNYFDGGRKFARNAPSMRVNELDIGLEWQPWPEVEITVAYTRTFRRTNTRSHPFLDSENADRIGIQAQWNY